MKPVKSSRKTRKSGAVDPLLQGSLQEHSQQSPRSMMMNTTLTNGKAMNILDTENSTHQEIQVDDASGMGLSYFK